MDHYQNEHSDELKLGDVHHEVIIKSTKTFNIKKNNLDSDQKSSKRKSDIVSSTNVKKKKKYETALAAIYPENDHSHSQFSQDYAEGFIKKIRERLDLESFNHAIKLLGSLSNIDTNITLLYQQITEILTDKNEDLIYEFLGFLLPGQALSIGKFSEYLELTRMKEFIRKLQVCMKKQPAQIRRILDNLYNLSMKESTTPLEVHMIMLPLLKNNPILVDCFLQIIPSEHPPESLFSEDSWEELDINESVNYGIDYEEINPSDTEDLTYLNLCHCSCHKDGESSHCRSCGLKFFKGRIYFDTPEGLKLAKIKFEGGDQNIVLSKIDKLKESVAVKQKNRKCHSKNNSPGSAEDIKGSTGTESEEDLIDIKPKKRQKSKAVQSLKLKFKKEESPKCKAEEELCVDNGKSIVHVNNEELNSSEMVFFCIQDSESTSKELTSISNQESDIKEKMCSELLENTCKDTNESVTFMEKEKNFSDLDNYSKKNSDVKIKEENRIAFQSNVNQINEESNVITGVYGSSKPDFNIDASAKCEFSTVANDSIISKSDKNQENHVNEVKFNNINSIASNNFDINSIKSEHITKICNSNNLELEKQKKEDYDNQQMSKWTIDEDKIILQTCKRVEDIEVLLETINRRIPQRSVSEIQERFTTLMTLLEQMIDIKQN